MSSPPGHKLYGSESPRRTTFPAATCPCETGQNYRIHPPLATDHWSFQKVLAPECEFSINAIQLSLIFLWIEASRKCQLRANNNTKTSHVFDSVDLILSDLESQNEMTS